MPVYKKKQACTQADGDKGTYTLYHKLKNGKEEKVGCSTSKKKAQSYVKGSYADWDWDQNKKNESFEERILQKILEWIEFEKSQQNLFESDFND